MSPFLVLLDGLGVLAGPPDPGTGSPPPGSGKLLTALGWLAWVVSGLCVAGVMGVAARMALVHHRGEGGQHAAGLAWVMLACVLLGSASGLVGALLP
jgi:hypothetical protein